MNDSRAVEIVGEAMKVNKNRIDCLDWAKGFCIMLIVLMHASSVLDMDLSARLHLDIATQMFFFLAGVVFKETDSFRIFLRKKVNNLLIPFAFFYSITGILIPNILHLIGYNVRNTDALGVRSIYAFASTAHAVFPNGPIWFLLCLFIVSMVFYGICSVADYCNQKTDKKWIRPLIILVASWGLGLAGYLMGKYGVDLYLYFDTAASVMPFYGMGYILSNYTSVIKRHISTWILIPLMLVGGLIAYFFTPPICCIANRYDGSFLLVYLSGFTGIVAASCLAKLLNNIPSFMLFFGRHSLIILCTHMLIMHFSMLFINKLPLDGWGLCILAVVFVMLAECLVIPVMVRFFPHVTAQKSVFK